MSNIDDWSKIFGADEPSRKRAHEDEDAVAEAAGFGENEDLEREADANQHNRREWVRNQIGKVAGVSVWIGAILLLLVATAYVWHLIGPWTYLEPEEVRRLQESLSAIALGGVLGFLARNRYF